MTKDDISKIKEHIEIHARQEPRAVKITEILWRAVGELEHIADLKQECLENESEAREVNIRFDKLFKKYMKAKELLKDITSSYGSTEVSEAQLYLKIKKAELFLKDSEVEK